MASYRERSLIAVIGDEVKDHPRAQKLPFAPPTTSEALWRWKSELVESLAGSNP
jgi:hypothetical protein